MYRPSKPAKTSLKRNESYPADTLEVRIERMMHNGEPIGEGAAIQYTERKDGVHPMMDIRTDRFELAVDARDKSAKSHLAKRDQAIGERSYDTMTPDQQKEFNTKYPDNKYAKSAAKNEGKP